tara:strand:- start:911 stop:1600 length:690 start_codon:yes stop_codon:yes gene_type:complete
MIVCGSRKYEKTNLNPLIDYHDVIVRHNWLDNNSNYGTRPSDIQVLNCHMFNNWNVLDFDADSLLKKYPHKNIEEINVFKKYLKKCKNIVYYEDNNWKRALQVGLAFPKQPRVGLASIIEYILSGQKPIWLVGYSLNNNHFKTHATNKNPWHERLNNKYHSLDNEIKAIIALHNNNLIDASFCTIIDTGVQSNITLDTSVIQPTDKSIDLLRKVYGCKIEKFQIFKDHN